MKLLTKIPLIPKWVLYITLSVLIVMFFLYVSSMYTTDVKRSTPNTYEENTGPVEDTGRICNLGEVDDYYDLLDKVWPYYVQKQYEKDTEDFIEKSLQHEFNILVSTMLNNVVLNDSLVASVDSLVLTGKRFTNCERIEIINNLLIPKN